jgi:phosphotransacetylase
MNFIESVKQRAKNDIKTIVLPEAEDIRVVRGERCAIQYTLDGERHELMIPRELIFG